MLQIRHGLSLLCAAATARAACTPPRAHLAAQLVSGLMAFPQPSPPLTPQAGTRATPHTAAQPPTAITHAAIQPSTPHTPSLQPLWLGSLCEPTTLRLVVDASVALTSASLPDHFDAAKRARASDMAAYTARLRAGRVALRALARALIAVGPQAVLALLQPSSVAALHTPSHASAALALPHTAVMAEGEDVKMVDAHPLAGDVNGSENAVSAISGVVSSSSGNSSAGLAVLLGQLEGLLGGFVGQWSALKAHEERVAAEEAEMFKTKTRSTTIMNDEVRLLICVCVTFACV